jgi:hypothetical protein
MRPARACRIDSHNVGFAVSGRRWRDAAGPQVRERRPKAPRPCLGCDRMILTTCASRLCRPCLVRAAGLRGAVDEMHVLGAFTQTERGTVAPGSVISARRSVSG